MKKLLIDKENVVHDFGEDIVFAKGGAEDGGLQECLEEEATHIWNREKNVAYMADVELSNVIMLEVDEIPEEVTKYAYKYVDGEFVVNEDYMPPISTEDRLSAVEDMINLMLFGGADNE